MLEQWLELMSDDTLRWVVEGGIGAVWMLVVYFGGQLGKRLGASKEIARFFTLIGVALGLVAAFFTSLIVPGLQIRELFFAMTGGAAASQGIHATRKAYEKRKNGGNG